ncbi:MAG: lactonase family protein [Leptolyngbyaceae cyanobacterium]
MKLFVEKGSKRLMWGLIGLLVAMVGYGLLQLIEPVPIQSPTETTEPPIFAGRALLVASDADMVATAYADAQLDRVPGIVDTLSVIPLPLAAENPQVAEVPVSNSVMSWPQVIAVAPDGQRAYVVEVRSPPPAGVQALDDIDDMPAGQTLTVLDLSDPAQPRRLEEIAVGRNPEHISISPDGRFLAVNLEEPGRELLIIELLADGRLGQRTYLEIAEGPQDEPGNRAVVWHPSGQFLAMTQGSDRDVAFYAIQIDGDGAINLQPHGEPLQVGNHLSNGRFTADGQFFLVPDLKWNTQFLRILNFILNPAGEMIAIRFDETGQQHEVVSRTPVGVSPEGFDLSPDNRLIATVNMRRTYLAAFPPAWRGKPHSSLSLVQFDPTVGQLETLGEYGFAGLLPEQAVFDASGTALAVVIYNYRETQPRTSAVEFWQVVAGKQPQLQRSGWQIPVVRGAHDIRLVP